MIIDLFLDRCGYDVYNQWSCVMNRFHDKTNNRWDERNNFIKVPGKYDLLAMDYGSEVIMHVCVSVVAMATVGGGGGD